MNTHRIARLVAIAVLMAPLVGCSKGDQVNAHLERAGKLLYEKKSERARGEIDAAIKLDPSRTSTYRAAMSMYEARKLAADKARIAELVLERVQESKLAPMPPKNEVVAWHFQVGQASWDAKNLAKAEKEFRAALNLAPDDAQVLNELGYFYAQEGIKLNEAMKLTRRAVELAPNDGFIIDSYGWAQHRRGDYAAAIKTLKRAVELEPGAADLRYHLGAAYAGGGMKTEARIELNKALALNPRLPEAANLLTKLHN